MTCTEGRGKFWEESPKSPVPSASEASQDRGKSWEVFPPSQRPRPHPVLRWAGAAHRGCHLDELSEDLAGVARVDDLLDPEGLGAAERRAQLVQPVLDLP